MADTLTERVVSLETTIRAFQLQQQQVNERLLKAIEGNGAPGIKDRLTKLEYGSTDSIKAMTELTRVIAELTKTSLAGREAEEVSVNKLVKLVEDLSHRLDDHVKPGNLEHETIAKAMRTKPIRTILLILLAIAIFTTGAVSGYFEHIVSLLKGLP